MLICKKTGDRSSDNEWQLMTNSVKNTEYFMQNLSVWETKISFRILNCREFLT